MRAGMQLYDYISMWGTNFNHTHAVVSAEIISAFNEPCQRDMTS
jgi:hypothetical protein